MVRPEDLIDGNPACLIRHLTEELDISKLEAGINSFEARPVIPAGVAPVVGLMALRLDPVVADLVGNAGLTILDNRAEAVSF